MKVWANIIAYELVWLFAVSGAGHGHGWLALLALIPFAAWYLSRPDGAVDARLMLVSVLTGVLVESALALSDLVAYASPFPLAQMAPLWILCIWAAFALTLRHSFRFLHHKFALGLLLGGVGAPLAYLGAARGWHALSFPHGVLPAMAGLGVAWAIALPALLKLAVALETAAAARTTFSEEHAHVV